MLPTVKSPFSVYNSVSFDMTCHYHHSQDMELFHRPSEILHAPWISALSFAPSCNGPVLVPWWFCCRSSLPIPSNVFASLTDLHCHRRLPLHPYSDPNLYMSILCSLWGKACERV